jgi:hypothetical protein
VKDLVTVEGSRFNTNERIVALAIGDHLSDTGEAWPSVRALAAWTGLCTRSVERCVLSLTGPAGIFDLVPGGSVAGGQRRANTYRLRPPTTDSQSVVNAPNHRPTVGGRNTSRAIQTTDSQSEDPRQTVGGPPTISRSQLLIERPIERPTTEERVSPPQRHRSIEELVTRIENATSFEAAKRRASR